MLKSKYVASAPNIEFAILYSIGLEALTRKMAVANDFSNAKDTIYQYDREISEILCITYGRFQKLKVKTHKLTAHDVQLANFGLTAAYRELELDFTEEDFSDYVKYARDFLRGKCEINSTLKSIKRAVFLGDAPAFEDPLLNTISSCSDEFTLVTPLTVRSLIFLLVENNVADDFVTKLYKKSTPEVKGVEKDVVVSSSEVEDEAKKDFYTRLLKTYMGASNLGTRSKKVDGNILSSYAWFNDNVDKHLEKYFYKVFKYDVGADEDIEVKSANDPQALPQADASQADVPTEDKPSVDNEQAKTSEEASVDNEQDEGSLEDVLEGFLKPSQLNSLLNAFVKKLTDPETGLSQEVKDYLKDTAIRLTRQYNIKK